MGLLTYHGTPGACEIVTLDALAEGRGVGTALAAPDGTPIRDEIELELDRDIAR